MAAIAGIALAVAIGYPWLRGSWIIATMLTLAWLGIMLEITMRLGMAPIVPIVVAIIWAPFAIWRFLGRKPGPFGQTRALVGLELTR